MPHVETSDNNFIDLVIEKIQSKERIGYLEDFINDVFDIEGYYFKDLQYDEQERVFDYYESLKKLRFNKMNKISIIKKSLLMSNGFMQLWKNPDKYKKFINTYTNKVEELSLKYKNKSKAKIMQLVDKEFENKYYLNDFDLDTIRADYKKLLSNIPLSNESNFNSDESNNIIDNNEQDNSTRELDLSEHVDRLDNEKSETQENELQQEDEPFYDLQSIKYKKLSSGDVLYIGDELWCVTKKNVKKCWVQNLYNKKIKTFRPESANDIIEILTDESLESVIEDFYKENLIDNLPKILKR